MITPGVEGLQSPPAEAPASLDLSGLAREARSGGSVETEALLEQVWLIAHRYSLARLGSYPGGAHLADDVAQDVCIAVLGALPRYRDRGRPFEAFVHGVASRKVADAQRAFSRHPYPTDELPDEVDDAPTPEDRAVQHCDVEHAAQLLNALPENLREVMLQRVVAGLSSEETGAALGMTAGAVRVAQHRALTKMREHAERLAPVR